MARQSLASISCLKSTNGALNGAIRCLMRDNAAYRLSTYNLSRFVPGTRIPCGATLVRLPERLNNFHQMYQLYQESETPCPNGIGVGDLFLPVLDAKDWNRYATFPTPATEATSPPAQWYYMTVSVLFQARDYLQHLPRVSGTQRDVLGVPNSVRAVLGLTMRTYDHWHILDVQNNVCTYFRLLHVKASHTARDIFDAICFIEGWNNGGFRVILHYEVPIPSEECTVAQMIERSQNHDVPVCPAVSWFYAMEPLRPHSAAMFSAATQHGTDDLSDSDSGDEEHAQYPIYMATTLQMKRR